MNFFFNETATFSKHLLAQFFTLKKNSCIKWELNKSCKAYSDVLFVSFYTSQILMVYYRFNLSDSVE